MKTTTLLNLLFSLLFGSLVFAQTTGFYTDMDSAIKHPENVYILDLSHRGLKSLPDTFEIFSQLNEVRFAFNDLKQLPKSLSKLEGLTKVNLSGNVNLDIEQASRVLVAISNLKDLNLSNCGIMFLPGRISKCDSLKSLSLESNQILFLP